MNNRNAGLALAALFAGLGGGLAIIKPWEGKVNVGYADVVGIPTDCYGNTHGARIGVYRTDAECELMLNNEVKAVVQGLGRCVTREVQPNEAAALISVAYNAGTGAICKSSMVRRLNAGEPASGWCQELLRWNKAKGRVVLGLSNRRRAEYSVCIGN